MLTLAIMYLSFGCLVEEKAVATNKNFDNTKTIIIDAGHGGIDCGAVGLHNISEKDINLEISKKLKGLLEFNGFNVVMTREKDISICDDDCKTINQKKVSDIRNRQKIIDSHKNAIVLSIHQNKFSDSSCKGAQIFYSKQNEQSKTLAECLQKSFINKLQPNNKREIQEDKRDLYLLKHTKNPIVLIECGFLSNQEDVNNLSSDDYQKKIALTLFSGIIDFYTEK